MARSIRLGLLCPSGSLASVGSSSLSWLALLIRVSFTNVARSGLLGLLHTSGSLTQFGSAFALGLAKQFWVYSAF